MPYRLLPALLLVVLPDLALAAEVDGHRLPIAFAIPFAGMLLSIAVLPLFAPTFWHHHYGKVAAGWALALVLPFAAMFGPGTALHSLAHTLLAEYLPFIVLLVALFTVAGGIHVRGNLHGSPGLNCGLLAIGAVLASLMGTTGASMLLIRPLIRANDNRRHVVHTVVFFIFIVGNIGGSLTPLGDPPLFLGFLQGVGFFWTLQHLLPQTLFLVGALLAIFFLLDSWLYRREGVLPVDPTPDTHPGFGIEGAVNLLPLAAIVALVLMSGLWKTDAGIELLGTRIGAPQIVRDGLLVAVTIVSLAITPKVVRERNQFSWAPMQEVAKLFVGIFLTMTPVLAMLAAGADGPFAAVVRAVSTEDGRPLPAAYFWLSGGLSSFLDNAPTYLVFFNLAGGRADELMTTLAPVLTAISAGSVYMGANTYIGNAPNFMIKAIAEDRGVRMPGFFGYMLWSFGILVPLFIATTWIWFRQPG